MYMQFEGPTRRGLYGIHAKMRQGTISSTAVRAAGKLQLNAQMWGFLNVERTNVIARDLKVLDLFV